MKMCDSRASATGLIQAGQEKTANVLILSGSIRTRAEAPWSMQMEIKFWGVRGSIPTPERRNSRYGGNTTCVEVRLADGTLIILDCGSGLRALGNSLLRRA